MFLPAERSFCIISLAFPAGPILRLIEALSGSADSEKLIEKQRRERVKICLIVCVIRSWLGFNLLIHPKSDEVSLSFAHNMAWGRFAQFNSIVFVFL